MSTRGSSGPRARSGWLPFNVAILSVVVGLLLITCAFLIGYGLYAGRQSIELLRREYLDQVAETSVREVAPP